MNIRSVPETVPCLMLLVAGLSPQRHGFSLCSVHVRQEVGELGTACIRVLRFPPCQNHFTNALYSHKLCSYQKDKWANLGTLLKATIFRNRRATDKQDRQYTYPRNTEACSRNKFCRGKAINITHSEYVSVTLDIQHVKHMRRIIQGVPGGKDLTSGECSLGQTVPI